MEKVQLSDIKNYKLKLIDDSYLIEPLSQLNAVIPFKFNFNSPHKVFQGLDECDALIFNMNGKNYLVGQYFDNSSTYGTIRTNIYEVKNFDLVNFLTKHQLVNTLIEPVNVKCISVHDNFNKGINFFLKLESGKISKEPLLNLYTKDYDNYYPEAIIHFNQSLYGNIKKKSLSIK
jgi:hypothetical protein